MRRTTSVGSGVSVMRSARSNSSSTSRTWLAPDTSSTSTEGNRAKNPARTGTMYRSAKLSGTATRSRPVGASWNARASARAAPASSKRRRQRA